MNLIQVLPYLSKKENRIRNYFKFYIILFTILSIFRAFVQLDLILSNNIFYLVFGIVFILARNYLLYYCAYKKHGNVWITIQMILSCYGTFMLGWTVYASEIGKWIDVLFSVLNAGLICFLGLNLIKINKKILLHHLFSSEKNRKAIDAMHIAQTLEELTDRYSKAFRICSRQYARIITTIYKEQKQRITKVSP